MRRPVKRATKSAAAILLLAAALPGCTSLEPRAGEPVPTQVAKAIAYVPASIVYGAAVFAGTCAAGSARRAGETYQVERELGRPMPAAYEVWRR